MNFHVYLILLLSIAMLQGALAIDDVILGERVGPVTINSSAKTLTAELGSKEVVTTEVGLGEGEVETGTMVFPGSRREMTVFWRNQESLSAPYMIRISRPGTPWSSPAGITIGSTIRDLHEANEAPFEIYGLGWDYGGSLASWGKGRLKETHGITRLFSGVMGYDEFRHPDYDSIKVMGDSVFPSTHPDFKRLEVAVKEIVYLFPELVNRESLGKLRLDLTEEAVIDILPIKPTVGREIEEGATGAFVEAWSYSSIGVHLMMGTYEKGAEKAIHSIAIAEPSTLKTARGIGLGATESEVETAYANEKEKFTSRSGEMFVAGSIYGGLLFSFEDGRVSEIFLGAAAE